MGLAPWLKNELARLIYPPRTLSELRVAVLQIDSNYWKCEMERKREDPSANTTQSSSKKKSNSKSSPTSDPKSQSAKGKVPSGIASVLGSDGHLLPAERERRLKEGLCLICGSKDHRARDCPDNKNNPKAQGRATTTEDNSDESTSSDSTSTLTAMSGN